MDKISYLVVLLLYSGILLAQVTPQNTTAIDEDLNIMIEDILNHYIYLDEKHVDWACIRAHYLKQVEHLNNREETLLLFEYLLDELYDSHVILNTNVESSFRLYAPIYAVYKHGKPIIANVWQSCLLPLHQNFIGAELLQINRINISDAIEQFPTHCHDKQSPKVREWLLNKLLAGRYDQPRILTIRMRDGSLVDLDIDELQEKKTLGMLTVSRDEDIGIIRINNTLGDNQLVVEFDDALDSLMDTRGLILDLRNTVDGGNSYVARGLMGRFIQEEQAYQKHWTTEYYDGNTAVESSWMEYVTPRTTNYSRPLVILVGRWTGSMGEGITIGLDGMGRATVVGTEMERLAGEMRSFPLKYHNFGYRLSTTKLSHVNGMPREEYIPVDYVEQTTVEKDEILERGIKVLKRMMK